MQTKMWNRIKKKVAGGILIGIIGILAVPSLPWLDGMIPKVEATEDSVSQNTPATISRTSDRVITDDDRADADEDMLYYLKSLPDNYHGLP